MSRPAAELPAIGYRGRVDRVRSRIDADGFVTGDPANIRWLTGFTGSTAWAVLTPHSTALVTDGRYAERAEAEVAAAGLAGDLEVVVGANRLELRDHVVALTGHLGRVGAEAARLTHAAWTELEEHLPLVAADGAVEAERRSKDAGELARIADACRIADAALAEVAPRLGDGLTEVDVRDELEHRMRRLGADGPSYDTIVATGPVHAARPHHGAVRRTIVAGDTVVIDVGALVDGYHSDMTRSYVVGDPEPDQQSWYDLVLAAQLAGLAAVAPGVATRDIDAACRRVFEDAGVGEWYVHASGHGVGLAIHEEPFHSRTSNAELLVGDVVTVEPGLYRAGFGGLRVEDLVEVTETGHRILTHSPKDAPCLPSPPTT
jgi:Xaa-Pro aminopeptidase